MNATTRKELLTEAARSLRNYLATGLGGFLVKATDRLSALDITVTPQLRAGDRAEAEHVAHYIEIGWVF